MTVAAVRTHVVSCPVERPFTSARGWLDATRASCLVGIETDQGIVGWGECFGPAAALKAVVDTMLAPRMIGRDPFDVGVIWEDLYNRVKDYGLTGLSVAGISGTDIALWDVVGRALGRPIHKLIGGGDLQADAARVAAVCRTVGGDIRLAMDANHCFSVPNAIRLGRMREPHDILWFEEPISPEDRKGYAEVTRALDPALAGGENEFTRWGFRDIVVEKAMDIVQPDLCAAGGSSACLKIATLASAHGVECVPQAWGSAIGLAASVQFLAALPDQPPAWRPIPPMLEFEQTPNPLRDRLAREPIVPREGIVRVPETPGIGIEIDRDALMRFKTA